MIDKGQWGGIWSGHWGYTLYEKCHGIFNDHRESGPRFNVPSERLIFLILKRFFFGKRGFFRYKELERDNSLKKL